MQQLLAKLKHKSLLNFNFFKSVMDSRCSSARSRWHFLEILWLPLAETSQLIRLLVIPWVPLPYPQALIRPKAVGTSWRFLWFAVGRNKSAHPPFGITKGPTTLPPGAHPPEAVGTSWRPPVTGRIGYCNDDSR